MKSPLRIFSLVLCALVGTAAAQPTFESPSPTQGSSTSQKANEMADKGMYKPVEYVNAAKPGPMIIVIPGEVKSNNANFAQKFGPNNIADFAELELGKANFKVLERSSLGHLLQEFQLAYNLGDPQAARKYLQKGKLKTTKWVMKFDILKAEQVAQAQEGFSGRPIGALIGIFGGGRGGAAGDVVVSSVQTGESTGVWIIGMRWKIIDANTTEQVATGYTEEKMELGAKSTSVMGFSSGEAGGLTLDGMVQRLVQKNVWEIDSKYK
jgi:PAS domain-containing protein